MAASFAALIETFTRHEVEFVVVGGAAAIAHGSATSLRPFEPYLRGAPAGLPFQWSKETLARGLNFTLVTSLGAVDLLGEITGCGGYQDLAPHAVMMQIFDSECLCLSLPQLILAKRAAGRPKDLQALAELEALAEER